MRHLEVEPGRKSGFGEPVHYVREDIQGAVHLSKTEYSVAIPKRKLLFIHFFFKFLIIIVLFVFLFFFSDFKIVSDFLILADLQVEKKYSKENKFLKSVEKLSPLTYFNYK